MIVDKKRQRTTKTPSMDESWYPAKKARRAEQSVVRTLHSTHLEACKAETRGKGAKASSKLQATLEKLKSDLAKCEAERAELKRDLTTKFEKDRAELKRNLTTKFE